MTKEQVEAVIGMDVSAPGAPAAMKEKGISETFTIGSMTLRGLALDTTYTLHEITPPESYIIASNDAAFTLTRDNTGTHITATGTNVSVDEDGITLLVSNEPGIVLPKTGGIGTRWFSIPGSLLVLCAGFLFINRKKD